MVRKNLYLYNEQAKFLKKLPGNESEHIRRAIADYIEKLKNQNVSTSLSEGKKCWECGAKEGEEHLDFCETEGK